jgi:hypothetical protein
MKVHIETNLSALHACLKTSRCSLNKCYPNICNKSKCCFHIFGPLNFIIQTQVDNRNTQMCPNCLNFETITQMGWGDETKFNVLWLIFEKIICGFVIMMSFFFLLMHIFYWRWIIGDFLCDMGNILLTCGNVIVFVNIGRTLNHVSYFFI